MEITTENFEQEVLQSDQPVLVDFWAPWCGPCRQLTPIVEKLAQSVEGAKVFKLNIDSNQQLAQKYSVNSIPTILFFKDGAVVNRLVGIHSEAVLRESLEKLA